MMFGRRAAPGLPERIRYAVWPRTGWRRSFAYHGHRLARLQASPHCIAAGLASGVALSVTPLLGLQMLLAAALALLVRGNVFASAAGTFFANPWTLPFIWLATFRLGSWMLLGADGAAAAGLDNLSDALRDVSHAIRDRDIGSLEAEVRPLLLSMLIGSLPVAVMAWFLTYWPARHLVQRYRDRRLRRLRSAAAARRGAVARPPAG